MAAKFTIINFRELEALPKSSIIRDYYYKADVMIEVDACPICGSRAFMNGTGPIGPKNFAWCSKCGTEGPKHWDWIKAAKMWNSRSLAVIEELQGE